jgi:hypothetical protein
MALIGLAATGLAAKPKKSGIAKPRQNPQSVGFAFFLFFIPCKTHFFIERSKRAMF